MRSRSHARPPVVSRRLLVALAAPLLLLGAAPAHAAVPAPAHVRAAAAVTPETAIQRFKARHLEVGRTFRMKARDYAGAPLLATRGVRFLIPSIGPQNGGRVMIFRKVSDLRRTKRFYDGLSGADPLYFTWTFANEKRRILLQMNGPLGNARANAYGQVIRSL